MIVHRVHEIYIPACEFTAALNGFDYLWVKYAISVCVPEDGTENKDNVVVACDVIHCGYTTGLSDPSEFIPRHYHPKPLVKILRMVHK